MKKNLPYITIIILFIGALTFDYLRHGIPAVFFSDLGGIYPELKGGDKNLLMSFISGWKGLMSVPSYLFDSGFNFAAPLALFFMEDIWLRIKIIQILQMFFAAVFSYLFSRHIFKDKKIALLSGLFYATTPFFFSMLNGHNALTWSYVLLPAAFILVEKMFLTRKIFFSIAAGIMIALVTFFAGFQFIFYIGIPVMGYGAIRCANFIFQNRSSARRYILLTGLSFFCVFAFSSFFLLPTFFGHRPYAQFEGETAYRQNDFVTNFYTPNLKEVLSLQNKEQIVSPEFGYDLAQLPKKFAYFYISASIIALFSVFLVSRNKQIFHSQFNYWPFFIVSVLSFILSFGKHTFLFRLFNDFFPYFWTIRTPGRFLIVYALFVSTLAPFVVYKIFLILFGLQNTASLRGAERRSNPVDNKERRLWMGLLHSFQSLAKTKLIKIIFVLSGTLLIFYVAIFFSRSLLTFKTLNNMDEHYVDLSDVNKKLFELNPNNDYRVIDLVIEKEGNPHHLKAYSAGQRTLINNYDIIWRFKDDPNFARILGMLNIKYIITAPWPSWPAILDAPFPPLENGLEHNQDFKLAYNSPLGIKIWENRYTLPATYEVMPVFVIGPSSSVSSFLDLAPNNNNFALFFAGQITDKKRIEDAINKSKLIFIDSRSEEKPLYLNKFNAGFVLNSDFYLNPQKYSDFNKEMINLAKASGKPIIERKQKEQSISIDLLSNKSFNENGVIVEVIEDNVNIAKDENFGFRLEPKGFNEKAEIIYKIHGEKQGKFKITTNSISLFDVSYVKLSISSDNQDYKNILNLQGNNKYPDFYDGALWSSIYPAQDLFLKIELFTNKETSRAIYDSRVVNLQLDFIVDPEYNYSNINHEEFLLQVNGGENNAIVSTEIYSPEWKLFKKDESIKSLPVNIFSNGFLAENNEDNTEFTIKYGFGAAQNIGLIITLGVVILMIAALIKRI